MTDRQIDDIATQIGDRLYVHLSPVGSPWQRPITHELTREEIEAFAVEVGHAAYKAAERLLGERQTAEHDALNAEVTS
jgi:hypothetical protein